jgi:hypothetical protein
MHNQGHEAQANLEHERKFQSLWQLYLTCEDILIWWQRKSVSSTPAFISLIEQHRLEIANDLRAQFPVRWANETQPNQDWLDSLKSFSDSPHAPRLTMLVKQLHAKWRVEELCMRDNLTRASNATSAASPPTLAEQKDLSRTTCQRANASGKRN